MASALRPLPMLLIAIVLISGVSLRATTLSVSSIDDDDIFESNIDVGVNLHLGAPIVSVWGGQSMFSRSGMGSSIQDALSAGLILGTERIRTPRNAPGIRHLRDNGIYLWHAVAPDPVGATSATLGLWRFGFESVSGYGYAFSDDNTGVYFLSGGNGGWSILDLQQFSALPDAQYLHDFGSDVRFGEAMKAGIAVRPTQGLSITAGYEWNQIYPRHMFWYWILSQGMEGAADGLANIFVKSIGKTSPAAVPVMHFLLRNGIAAGFKALRVNRMNWPFNTVTPLNVHTVSLSATITF